MRRASSPSPLATTFGRFVLAVDVAQSGGQVLGIHDHHRSISHRVDRRRGEHFVVGAVSRRLELRITFAFAVLPFHFGLGHLELVPKRPPA